MTRGRWLAVAIAAAVLASGALWWAPWARDDRSGPVVVRRDDPRIFVYDGDLQTMISFSGSLPVSYDQATRCFHVTDRQGAASLVLWPDGSQPVIHEGQPGVRVPGLGSVTAGDTITKAGLDWGDIRGDDNFGIGAALSDLDTCIPASGSFVVLFSISAVTPGDPTG